MGNVVFLVVRTDNSSLLGSTESIAVCSSEKDAADLIAAAGWSASEVEVRRLAVMDTASITRAQEAREAREAVRAEAGASLRKREASDRAWAAFVARRPSCEARPAPESRCRSSKRVAYRCEVSA